uniref:Uncharacterized protein n=1 Tax=Sphaerodactylus townsendi TaxID=933632 RepID=A0ACB8FP73_9SAUR
MDECAKQIIDGALMKIQKQLLEKSRHCGMPKSNNHSSGYNRHDGEKTGAIKGAKFPNLSPSKRGVGKQESHHRDAYKEDFSSILSSTIQKVMREAVNSVEDKASSTNWGQKQAPPPETRPQTIKAFPKPVNWTQNMYANIDHMEMLDIDQLVKSMTKLCLLETEGNSSNLASGDTSNKKKSCSGSSPNLGRLKKGMVAKCTGSQPGSNGVIVTNQNSDSGSLNKEIQAILQWMVASQFNVPNLTFLNDREGDLCDLPRLAQKATKKGYSVGDILQEVMSPAQLRHLRPFFAGATDSTINLTPSYNGLNPMVSGQDNQ